MEDEEDRYPAEGEEDRDLTEHEEEEDRESLPPLSDDEDDDGEDHTEEWEAMMNHVKAQGEPLLFPHDHWQSMGG